MTGRQDRRDHEWRLGFIFRVSEGQRGMWKRKIDLYYISLDTPGSSSAVVVVSAWRGGGIGMKVRNNRARVGVAACVWHNHVRK